MICNNCGTNNKDGYMFCVSCGTELTKVVAAQSSEIKEEDKTQEMGPTDVTESTDATEQTNAAETAKTAESTVTGEALSSNIFSIFLRAIKKPVTTAELMVDNANVVAAIIFIVAKSLLTATFMMMNSTYSYNRLLYRQFYMGDEVTVFIFTSVLAVLFDIIFVAMLFVGAKIFGSATITFKKMLSGYSIALVWPIICALGVIIISELQSVLLSFVVLFLAIFAFVIQIWVIVMAYVKSADIQKDKLAISFAIGVIASLFIFVIVAGLAFGELFSTHYNYGF